MDADSYSKHVGTIVENGVVTMALVLGQNLGLVQAMCQLDQPVSSRELADKLNFKERYTREWLSCMASANIVVQNPETRLYFLPPEHRPTLKNRGAFAPFLSVASSRVDRVTECFKKDGPHGFDYVWDSWIDWFMDYRDQMADHDIATKILPRLKQQGLTDRLEAGIRVLDLGCAAGSYTLGLAMNFPKSMFTGIDLVQKALDTAREKASQQGITNAEFLMADAHQLPSNWTKYFDYVFVYDVLHDLPNPQKALGQIHKVLKDDGQVSFIEIGFPSDPVKNIGNSAAAMYYCGSMFVCLPSSMEQKPHIGYGAMWGKEAIEMTVKEHGFKLDANDQLSLFGSKVFFLCSKDVLNQDAGQ